MILVNNNFEIKIEDKDIDRDREGRIVKMDLNYEEYKIRIIGVYGPNQDNPQFFRDFLENTLGIKECIIFWLAILMLY